MDVFQLEYASDPQISPDGKKIAYLGFDDKLQGYQVTCLSIMNRDGSGKKLITEDLDRDVRSPVWAGDAKTIYFQYDGRQIHGWIVKPPDFNPNKKYPLVLEIHGGPFANYGDRFSMENQLYSAAGYVVLYTTFIVYCISYTNSLFFVHHSLSEWSARFLFSDCR